MVTESMLQTILEKLGFDVSQRNVTLVSKSRMEDWGVVLTVSWDSIEEITPTAEGVLDELIHGQAYLEIMRRRTEEKQTGLPDRIYDMDLLHVATNDQTVLLLRWFGVWFIDKVGKRLPYQVWYSWKSKEVALLGVEMLRLMMSEDSDGILLLTNDPIC